MLDPHMTYLCTINLFTTSTSTTLPYSFVGFFFASLSAGGGNATKALCGRAVTRLFVFLSRSLFDLD